jgi:hypothetical protein
MDSGEDGVDRLRGERDAIGSGSFGSRGVSYDVRVGRLGRIAFVLGGRRRCWRGKDEGLEEFSLRLLRMMTRRGSERFRAGGCWVGLRGRRMGESVLQRSGRTGRKLLAFEADST